jgi:two-component system response regulator MprA
LTVAPRRGGHPAHPAATGLYDPPVSQQFTVGVCEDDDELRGVVRSALERDGYRVRATASGAEAVAAFAEHPPDVLILDIGLPDADGRDVCQALRARGVAMPVLFLTARDALSDRLSGFHSGGDDYVTKPFAVAELIVRIEALLRRSPPPASVPQGGALRLDPGAHGIAGPDETVPLTPTEFRLLAELAAHTGAVVRRAALVRAGWPAGAIVSENTLDAYISRIRSKLRQASVPETVENVRGVGYALR